LLSRLRPRKLRFAVKKPIPAYKPLAVFALLLSTFCLTSAMALAAEPLPLPSPQQLAWQRHEFIAFAHFGMNTFTDREWGEGKEDPTLFNPTDFDARQWAAVLKDAGVKLLILTAKHHDGFCLWPSQFTEHCVKNSPWRGGKGDVVREVVDALREKQIRVGLYLSPWDRNQPTYGDSPKYNQYFCSQLRELLTNYGPIDEVWFDGANGEGPNGKKQEYDWPGPKLLDGTRKSVTRFSCLLILRSYSFNSLSEKVRSAASRRNRSTTTLVGLSLRASTKASLDSWTLPRLDRIRPVKAFATAR